MPLAFIRLPSCQAWRPELRRLGRRAPTKAITPGHTVQAHQVGDAETVDHQRNAAQDTHPSQFKLAGQACAPLHSDPPSNRQLLPGRPAQLRVLAFLGTRQDVPRQVIRVPARVRQDHPGAGSQASHKRGRKPLPDSLPDHLGCCCRP